jgi:hypothetical protein
VLLDAAEGRIIEKDRYTIDYPASKKKARTHKIELDIYKSKLEGLVTAEVEFKSKEEEKSFIPPAWFGADVTLDKRFKNQYLATDGLEAILLSPNPRYRHVMFLLCSDLPADFLEQIQHMIRSCGKPIETLARDRLPVFAGRIFRATADAIRSCALMLVDSSEGDPSTLAWIAVRLQSGNPYLKIPSTRSDKQVRQFLHELGSLLASDRILPSGFLLGGDTRLSDFVKRQRFVDNETLSDIEQQAESVNVITTTLEQDVGELEFAVKRNLLHGKRYNYFVPSIPPTGIAYPELQGNLPRFRDTYLTFRSQIRFYSLTPGWIPYFREIVVYDEGKYGFTYLEPADIRHTLELIELPPDLLGATMNWLRANSVELGVFE